MDFNLNTGSSGPSSKSQPDQFQILDGRNAPLFEETTCIHDAIQSQVLAQADAQAICTEEGSLSYCELDQVTTCLARYLITLGVGSEAIVPLCFDKSMWNVISMLGVLKAGAAFVPLDPTAPIARLQTLVDNVGAKMILCSQNHASFLATAAKTIIPIDGEVISQLPQINRDEKFPSVESSNLAYLIYTSGTTGQPKATMIEHGAFCSGARAHAPAMLINSKSRVLQFAAHTFDASLVEILTTLIVGGTVCIPSEDTRLNNVVAAMNDMRVNLAILTPSFVGFIEPAQVPGLRTLVLAGEAMSHTHIKTWSGINLVNGYGPSECSVAAVVNSKVTSDTEPTNIGLPVGAHLWVVDPEDYQTQVPVGSVGELLVQGPTLARGYHNDPKKTAESFVQPPPWALAKAASGKAWRMYKTGDLVQQSSDGTFRFVGRKDHQVKVHGQRVELEEIEQNFIANPIIKHGLVLLPKFGPFKNRLISIISLSATKSVHDTTSYFQVVEDSAKSTRLIQEHLASRLPAYMVPSKFIVVNGIPLLPSGKLDRKAALTWAQTLSDEVYRRIVAVSEPSEQSSDASPAPPSSEIESKLRDIWSHVLNLNPDQIDLNRSFLSLGGDSISAMQVKGHCMKKSINLSVQDILRSKSIAQLAQCAKPVEQSMQQEEILEHVFDLSPIQSLFFKLPNQGQGHFNQSFFLRITRRVQKKDLRQAIETIIARHSMLRARFSQLNDTGDWQQRITSDIATSYRLKGYNVATASETTEAIADSQTCLDPANGPLFAADLFDVDGDDQLLFMVGHHLVIDLVSWRVILEDLEEILRDPSQQSIEAPLSFQTWCQMQAQHSQGLVMDKVLPVDNVPGGDAKYWGMEEKSNTYGNVTCEGFEVDSTTTSLLLTKCHDTLHTETIDVLLSALIHSFAIVFPDRSVPAIYNEGHGREPSGMPADLSRTVGWFTTMYPVHVPTSGSGDLIDTVRHVKDLRRKIPDNGRPYFASRSLTSEGHARFGHHWPLEITFNYLGQYQQLERAGALLTPVEDMAGEARGAGGTADVGQNTPRFGLFEISAVIVQGKLRFSFTFNRHIQQQAQISNWISLCHQTVGDITEKLVAVEPQVTLGDFPLLSLDYDGLHTMVSEKLPKAGVLTATNVEDIYPCSSMQEGLLISQTKDSGFYAVQVVSELRVLNDVHPSSDRLADAWQKVVDRHPLLRTVFIESVSKDDGLYDQMVLKTVEPDVIQMNCSSEKYALRILGEKRPMVYKDGQPPHRLTICKTSDKKVLCKLEISHTIMDGGSMSIILRDLTLAYEGLLRDGPGPLYSDYIGYLQSRPGEASIEYWNNYLSEIEPCSFPILNDGISVEKELRSLRLDFTSTDFAELKSFCDQNGFTVSNALHTAWGLTLRCYTDSDDICFGYLTSGRDAPVAGIENAVGPFINMLVCRMNMVPANRLRAVLDQVQKDYMDSIPHRYISLAEVQHALKLSGTALFNTALSYRKLPTERKLGQQKVSFVERIPIYDPTEYNLSINIEASDREAVIDLDYWTDAISEGQVGNIAATFIKSLQNIVHHSQQTISQLDHLSDQGFNRISAWNSNIPEAIEDCVHNVIKQQAQLQPSASAVCAWDATFTYAELDELSSRLATYLISLNVQPESFVPTCFDKSGWTIVAMLAVLKAGAAAVPLDATHPKSALEVRVSDTQAQIVLAAPSRAAIFEDMVPSVVSVSKEFLDQLPKSPETGCETVVPKNSCFVIFTSGSTGKPKGVVLEHRAIVTSGYATSEAYGFGPHSRVLQFAAYTFDNSLAEIFFTLMRGGCVCVPSEHDRFNNLAEAINKLDVNFMDITPTVASFLRPSDVPHVKGVSLGGEPLTKENIEVWGKSVALHCCYGPSECSVNSTWNGDLTSSSEATNIGKSIGSVSWVVDPSDQDHLTPIGGVGELLIEGPILARGYLNDPEKTSKAFIQDPKWAVGGNRRMYKTGDLARLNSNGTITYLGRKDTQVKLNGQRLEIGEVEHHVKISLPAESQSAVELVKINQNQKSTKALAAFLCLQSDGSVPAVSEDSFLLQMTDSVRSTAVGLETTLASSLPAYMVPTVYIPVAKLPMTSSGKLDRRRLRMICETLSGEQSAMYRLARKSGRSPSTEMEITLGKLWETVLNIESGSVSAEDNFFRLGGDSIGAMKLITAARAQGISLTVANIFQKPKLSDISRDARLTGTSSRMNTTKSGLELFSMLRKVESISQVKDEVASLCQVDVQSIQDIYPCTAIQEGLVALSNKDPGAYVAQNIYQLPLDIDLQRFKAAWQKVVAVEVILRTRVVYTESLGFLQVVVREPLVWHTASTIQEVVDEHRLLPAFNGGLLSRYTLVEEQGNLQFVWTAHHSLYDGWCISTMLDKVEAYYHDMTAKVNNEASYPNFIKFLSEIDEAESDEFWRTKLSETTALQFPALPHPSYQVHATSLSSHTAHVSRESGSQITLPSTIRAAWAMVVGIYSGSQEDVVFGETLTGRDAPVEGIADMIGPTLATVPTRVLINPDSTVSEFLEGVQTLSADAIPYQYAGLQHIKHISEDTGIACGFQNLLAIHHETGESSGEFWDLRSSGTIGTNFYSYPLTISCQIGDGKVDIDAHYDQAVISTWQVDKMLHQFEFILERLNSPDTMNTKISDINILNSQDLSTIMGWNNETVKPVDKCVHQLIEQQVCEQPEAAIAVESWDAKLTYRELDELSTRLAQHLMNQNVNSELVPLCFEKSAWTIVAMLAVLKAGAAFVPLDPTAPVSRLRDILADIKATIILCSSKYLNLTDPLDVKPIKVDRDAINQLAPAARFAKRWDKLPSCDSKRPAYCIFTSGTTGKPKGTIVQHAAFCAGVASHAPALRMHSTSRVLQFASYTFDASLLEILTTLTLGGTVCVPSDEDRLNNITKVINEMRITWTLLTPSFIQLIQPSAIPTLRTLVLGGEAMSQSHISTWADKLELINAYGPSECAVVATVNPHMSLSTDPSNMGHAVGGRAWITEIRNHDRLAPIGSIGELVIEGPILAQGYLNNEAKTAEVFIENPAWSITPGKAIGISTRRMYKTGDLVKYTLDGNMLFCGRKDTQVKLHGQRLELGEVEHYMRTDPAIQHALATIPTSGFCKKRLVAVISIQELATSNSASTGLEVVAHEACSFYLTRIRERLCDQLPAYMIPSNWVVLQRLPLLPSGKLDRRQIDRWVEEMSPEVYRQISDVEHDNDSSSATVIERQLQIIWGNALNLPAEQIGLHQSFLHLGGDSISAMQVMSKCRSQDLGVTVQDIIQSKSISQLAQCVTLPEKWSFDEEELDTRFDLSPMQKLYFECVGDKWSHFNQSVLLRLGRKMDPADVVSAIEKIATSHSMLRARFSQNEAGTWQQKISSEVASSYRFDSVDISMGKVTSLVEHSQKTLDIQTGPTFAVDLLNIEGENQQLISLVAHHLVIDVVSWRIILQDLEDVLESGTIKADSSLPFQTWSRLQVEHTQQTMSKNTFHPEDIPVADLGYWDMAGKSNVYGDTIEDGFEIDAETSLQLLGICHDSLNTDPVDIFLTSVMASFRKVFSDRSAAPAIFNEGHGREPWSDSKLDLSRTVGWFTTMCPVYLPFTAEGDVDLVNTIRWVKDLRNRIPDKGRPYFAYRLLTEEGRQRFPGHWPMEVTFNYLGKLQQLERKDAILQQVDGATNADFDIGADVPRFALFEISAEVTHGTIKVSFSYNKKMKRQAKIRRWVMECQRSLQDAAQRLVQIKPERTLSDFKLLPLSYTGMSKLNEKLPLLGVSSLEEVEDVYPCSPMQQGMLLAQLKNPHLYAYSAVFEARSTSGESIIDARLLADAWQDVVSRHSALRTIFIEGIGESTLMDQVVLRALVARISWLESEDSHVEQTFAQQENISFRDKQPPHRFTLCKTDKHRVFCKLEISHTISDGTSIPILLRDLSQEYARKLSSPGNALLSPDITIGRAMVESRSRRNSMALPGEIVSPHAPLYSEYIAHIQSKYPKEDLNYWKAYLADIEPCNFPALTDGKKPEKELRSLVLNLSQSSELRSFCTQNGVTLSNVLQLVWALVLRTYTGSTDVCFGYLTSGRDAPIRGIQDSAVGAFINMLTCRMDLKEILPLKQALDQIQTDFVQSMNHQACSLADVQHELQLSGTSLFNTAFTFQKRSSSTESIKSAIEFDILDAQDPSEYDVTVNVEALDSAVEVHFGYWTNILSEPQANNMSTTFDHILNQMIGSQSRDQTIGEINFFSEHSHQQVMAWNANIPAKINRCIHEIIDGQKLGRPVSTPAISAWDGNLTFTDLEQMTNRLATRLVQLGIGPEMYVPLCFEKSMWTVVSMIAVMKAGGAFVPLDPSHPQGRLKHFIDDVKANLVLCSSMHQEKISGAVQQTLVIDQNLMDGLENTPLISLAQPSNPAYIIFTSGTTGLPKGTIIEHAAFCTSATEHARAMCMRSDSRVFQFASHTFDASVMEILSTLIVGGCVCIPSDMDRMNDIPGAIRRMGVTWTLLTPSVANTLSPKSVPSLKVLVTGGEAMSSGHIAKWKGKKICLVNAYGPSETAVIASTSTKVDEDGNEVNSDTSDIGKAVGGRNWIVDPQNYNKLVPVGGIGELVVEGHIVARGYLNNEQKTSQAFVCNPDWLKDVKDQERMYRTGDLVRYNTDGTLSFVARKDTQIKLNGQRIELGEIEHQVKANMPEDSQSAVELVAPMSRIATKALAVFFCLPNARNLGHENEEILSEDEILLPMSKVARRVAKNLDSALAGVLPTYMIPSFYIPVTKMPWTSSGKLDRTRLRNIVATLPKESTAPYRLANTEAKTASAAPASDMEKKLQKLWENVMNVGGAVGVEDSFFRLGGDSVTAMKLVGAARLDGIALTVIDIFRNPKLADMALVCGVLEKEMQTELKEFALLKTDNVDPILDEIVEQCHVERDMVQDAYPCSFLQEGLLTLSIRQAGAYVAHNVFKIPSDLDIERFKSVWQKTVDEVDILRTRIVHMESSAFIQVVIKPEPIFWHNAKRLDEVKTEDIKLPTHNGGMLTQYTIVEQEGSEERFFVWSIHHGLYDGWSMPMVLSRVQSAYFDSTSSFPKSSYASFIKYVTDVDLQASDEFWRTRLANAAPLQFPQNTRAESNQIRDNQMLSHSIAISDDSAGMEVTIPTIIRAAWSMIVATYSGSNDVVFGETLAGRDIPVTGITDIIGPIFTTVPTRIQVDRDATISQFLRGVHQMATEIIPYQHAGLQRIKRLDPDTDLACDFQNLLVIQTAEEETQDEFWQLAVDGVADNFFTYPLVLECKASLDSTKVDINAHFDANVIGTWQVQRLLFQLDAVLKQLSTAQNTGTKKTLADVEIFSPQDRQLVQQWNSKIPDCLDSTVHEEFEEIAAAQPQSVALESWDGTFTYQQVKEHAQSLAHYLIDLGVGPDVFVPICMDKSAWVVISMIGIMMAGGAYSPFDPAAPIARHQEMIGDLDAKMILCTPKYSERYVGMVDHVLPIDGKFYADLLQNPRSGHDLHRATSSNAAYVIFTSGTTGKPKGCVLEHKAICTSSIAMRDAMLMQRNSRVYQFGSYTFDVSVLEIFTTLTYGGTVVIPSEETRVSDVSEALAKLNIDWTFLTPSVANLVDPSAVPKLKVLVCGGEAMTLENVLKWAPHLTLVNAYGPTEASVIGLVNMNVSTERNPANIGIALTGNHAWIADPADHNRIAPVGCPGELLLEGPILAREYIKNKSKTDEVFIQNPPWTSIFDNGNTSTAPRRMYKTGDLVRYNQNGTVSFIGRKDNQVKLHGQRMELGEIENALDIDQQVRHALVALPKTGHFKKRLIAILSLTDIAPVGITRDSCEPIQEGPRGVKARSEVAKAKNRLSERLPSFMIPSTWIAVESIPLLPSGKLDRRGVTSWLEKIDEKMYEKIMEADDEEDNSIVATDTSRLIQGIFSRVLNIPIQKVRLGSSFLSLGGDSITAMQVMAMCRKEKMNFSLSEVLRSKSIHQLALTARFETDKIFQEEKVDELFDLSPIQQLYFQAKSADEQRKGARFNQSFSLQITRKVEPQTIKDAINAIVNQHSMLRARMSKISSGAWKQCITKDAASSYRFRIHDVDDENAVPPIVADSQSSLDVQLGPLFAVDLFNISGQDQMLFMAAHHVVIDMMSWRIILGDLEEFINTGKLTSDKPLSFQVWSAMQAENSDSLTAHARLGVLPFNVGPSQISYWGMQGRENTYCDVICETFTVSEELTKLALGESNNSLRTEPVDLFLSAIAHSFSRVFVDRDTPALYNENHGRESWDSSIDISRTVGWFTTIFPVQIDVETDEDDVVDSVRRMKDVRRKVPDNGRPYFAQRFLTKDGKEQFKDHEGTMEVIFNYLGRMQQLEHDDSLLQQWTYPENEEHEKLTADVGPQAERFALFEISAAVNRDKIQFSFLFNKEMDHQQEIRRWITECQTTLEETIQRLAGMKEELKFTLSDFPLLPISYDGLEKIVTKSLPSVGVTTEMVDDIFPAAPLQEGLILSQIKDPSLYHFHAVFDVHPAGDGIPIDANRLLRAWQKVVNYHGALRTVFADSVYKGDIFNQIVVKNTDSGAKIIECEESEALEKLSKISILDHNYRKQPRLPHQITIAKCSSGKIYFKAEINHGVIDGGSANVMLRDLAAAYHGQLDDGPGPSYGNYIKFIKSLPTNAGTKFWKTYLQGARACHFPVLNKEPSEKRLGSVTMEFDRFPELQDMCKRMKVTLANVMQAAWALCLRSYTKSEDVCFGYLTSGRDVPVPGIQDTIGAYINMLVCRVKFQQQATLKEVYQKVQNDYLGSLEFQHTSLAQLQHDIAGGKPLFNTAVSIQKGGAADEADISSITFDPVAAHDPGEYAITLNVRTFINDEGIVLRYWTDFINNEQATLLAATMSKVLENFVNQPFQTVEDLDLSTAGKKKLVTKVPEQPQDPQVPQEPQHPSIPQLPALNSTEQLRALVSECVREVIEQMFKSGNLVSYGQQDIQNTVNLVNQHVVQRQPQAVAMIDYSQLSAPLAPSQIQRPKRIIPSEISQTPPNDDVEKRLLAIWSDLLQISEDSIRGDDSFFQLGGDSIIAMQMVGVARDEDLALTVASIFRHPTFSDMAAVIRLADESNAPLDITGQSDYKEAREIRSQTIQNALYQRYSLLEAANVDAFLQDNICPRVTTFRGGIVDVFPVTDFQALAITGTLMESKWMLNYFHLSGNGPLDLKRLKLSASRLVDAFDILRTVFVPYGNRFFQVVLRKLQPSFAVHETEDLAKFTTELQQSDRENGPRLGESYLQFTVAKEKETSRHRIIIRLSHSQYDGVCMPAILAALQSGYQGLSIPSVPAFSTYVRDAARRTTDDHYTYWKKLLKGSSMTDVIRRRGPNYSRGSEVTSLKRIVQFDSLASEAITPATIIKAAWSLVLARLSAGSDIVFGNVISGRNAAVLGVESIVGPCVNLVPVRIAFRSDWTVLDLLHHIQDQQVANMPYESLGFREIIKHCTDWPDWTNFSTVCQHQNIQRKTQLQLGKNEYTLGAIGSQEDFADITVLSTPQEDDKIEISLIFSNNSGITQSFAEEIFDLLCSTSTEFSTNPNQSLPSPTEFSEMERQTLDDPTPVVDASLSSNLQGISRDELLLYNDVLTRAWRQILWDKNGNMSPIDLDSSFYELGGDIIGVAQVASLLEQEGFKLRVEDLVDHPILIEQLALCAVYIAQQKEKEMAEADENAVPELEQDVPQKKGLKKIFGKGLGLRRKMTFGKKKDVTSTEMEGGAA